jgi:hypothetical protein
MYAHDTAIKQFKIDILINLLYLIKTRMWSTIWRHNAIAAEVLIMSIHPRAKIASIGPIVTTIATYSVNTLVHPVPYEATLEVWAAIYYVVELAKVARRVTHGVGILAEDEGLG